MPSYEEELINSIRKRSNCKCINLIFKDPSKTTYDYVIDCIDCGTRYLHIVPEFEVEFVIFIIDDSLPF
jgi:hypothetical protein